MNNDEKLLFKKNQIVTISSTINKLKENFTYEFWVKPVNKIMLPKEAERGLNGSLGQSYLIAPSHGMQKINAGVGVSVGTNGIVVAEHTYKYFPVTLVYQTEINNWTHIAIVYQNKTPSLYLNGKYIKSGLTSTKIPFASNQFGGIENYDLYFKGEVYDLRIWDHPRTNLQLIRNQAVTTNETGLIISSKKNPVFDQLRTKSSTLLPFKHLKNNKKPSVSVVIPTYNAMSEYVFEDLLKSLQKQKGFEKIEIIIVDSGSIDSTVSKAKEYGLKIIKISNDKFSHSYSRNLGASFASHEYILFTVQDALPSSDTWLFKLYKVIEERQVVAVSCSEIPREDADIYYRACMWNHFKFLGVLENDMIFEKPKTSTPINLRKNANLSNVACLMKTNIFRKYRFRAKYAEDLELGLRLVKDGYKLAFTSSIKVIHSHLRQPYYFLKRGYVDRIYLAKLFSENVRYKVEIQELYDDIVFNYFIISKLIERELQEIKTPIKTKRFIELMQNQLQKANQLSYPIFHHTYNFNNDNNLDPSFRLFLEKISNKYSKKYPNIPYKGQLLNSNISFLNIIFRFLEEKYEVLNERNLKEFIVCMYKVYAQIIGVSFANYYLGSNKLNQEIISINTELMGGV
ncbi:glycosyltransferase [Alkalihalobacterium elongatum]|uniref:glycosyltransferase n=1 Tax=Alkalihalobacterium elongatum TaxID=2675466 RepID=UPI001C1FEB6D|nr:glycosyltransferase [Alkalihalobacterium elongatum]